MRILSILTAAALLVGCAAKPDAELSASRAAFDARQFDQAAGHADAFLNAHPGDARAAQAFYLKGRAIEQRTAESPQQAKINLDQARFAYVSALHANPGPALEPFVRAGIANVAFYQDDYGTAVEQWSAAFPNITNVDTKSLMLVRIGQAQQRLGQFEQADKTFAQVQVDFPNSEAAGLARAHAGVRGFTVQFATFATPGSADAAIAYLKQQGIPAKKSANERGQQVVSVGPMTSYAQANALKARYAAKFPYALVLP